MYVVNMFIYYYYIFFFWKYLINSLELAVCYTGDTVIKFD